MTYKEFIETNPKQVWGYRHNQNIQGFEPYKIDLRQASNIRVFGIKDNGFVAFDIWGITETGKEINLGIGKSFNTEDVFRTKKEVLEYLKWFNQ